MDADFWDGTGTTSAEGDPLAVAPVGPAGDVEALSPGVPAFDEVVRTRLSEAPNSVAEGADPVAEPDSAIATFAGEPGRQRPARGDFGPAIESDGEMQSAIGTLVGVALEMDDPVAALEEGAETLAEALAAREAATQERLQAARERQIDEQAAYRHARLHRVSELIDVGHSLDQAVAITNANEADIRARAAAAGRNPMEPIYEYAVLNGYRSAPRPSSGPSRGHGPARAMPPRRPAGQNPSALTALADMSDDDFAEATKGNRWQELMGR